MELLVLFGVLWGTSALVRALREAKRQRKLERIRQEQARQKAEQARMIAEWRRSQAEAKAEAVRLARLEREQIRQAKEQEKQAAQLAKHEQMIARLAQQAELAQREIEHLQPLVNELRSESERLSSIVNYYTEKGLLCGGYKTQLERVNDKLYRAETKLIKAEFTKQNAEQKIA